MKPAAAFYDFDEHKRLVEAARKIDTRTYLASLLGGEAGLRCGEMIALEWADVDLGKRQLCVRRSDWNGQVTSPNRGRLRYVPLTLRLAVGLREHRHLRSSRVLRQDDGGPITRQMLQNRMHAGVVVALRALTSCVTRSVHTWRCVERQGEPFKNWRGTRSEHDPTVHAPESGTI